MSGGNKRPLYHLRPPFKAFALCVCRYLRSFRCTTVNVPWRGPQCPKDSVKCCIASMKRTLQPPKQENNKTQSFNTHVFSWPPSIEYLSSTNWTTPRSTQIGNQSFSKAQGHGLKGLAGACKSNLRGETVKRRQPKGDWMPNGEQKVERKSVSAALSHQIKILSAPPMRTNRPSLLSESIALVIFGLLNRIEVRTRNPRFSLGSMVGSHIGGI